MNKLALVVAIAFAAACGAGTYAYLDVALRGTAIADEIKLPVIASPAKSSS